MLAIYFAESAFDGPLEALTIKSTEVTANGVVLAQLEGLAGGGGSNGEAIYGAPGDLWRPLDADADGAAEVISARASDDLPVVAALELGESLTSLYLRINEAAATPLGKGTRRIAWYRGAQLSFTVAPSGTGTIVQLYVPFDHDGQGVPQKGHVVTLDPVAGAVTVVAASGAAVVLASDGSATVRSANGENFVSVSNDGVTLSGDLRVPNSNLVVGSPALAQDVALAEPLVSLASPLGQIVALLGAAVNGLAPGSVPAPLLAQLTTALAPYLVAASPPVPAAPTPRAPRIKGQPGP